jgi:hypothetical protein
VSRHLEPVPDPAGGDLGGFEPWDDVDDDDLEPLRRPSWWRPVAIVVVVAMVVATPVAYALYVLFR